MRRSGYIVHILWKNRDKNKLIIDMLIAKNFIIYDANAAVR